MTTPLWTPSAARRENSNLTRFGRFVTERYARTLPDYEAMHRWSVEEPAEFWSAIWDFCGVIAAEKGETVVEHGDTFPAQDSPAARWFPDARLNFAENLLRHHDKRIALVSILENGRRTTLTHAELYHRVAQLSAALRAQGVGVGDRVAGFLPNIAETVIAMLASTSLGAVWTSCSPDFGLNGVLDRFGQVRPKVLFAADGYYYNGKTCDCLERVAQLSERIDSLEKIVVIPLVAASPVLDGIAGGVLFDDFLARDARGVEFTHLPFDHPLYIMYSSGTTGVPKCIVHSAGGSLLQHLKEHRLQVDLSESDVFFYFTTCGWMMWNWLVSGLATGATLVLYDGSPFAGNDTVLLDAIDAEGINVFGASAKYFAALEKAEVRPGQLLSLDSLRTVLSTGSPLSHESFEYIYREFKQDLCLSSISGGTDILSCFVGGCPLLPVYSGEIQAAGLGMAVEIWNDDGKPVAGEKGELVCTRPFPSTPIGFWNDADGSRYRSAYFERWPNVWAQGDYGERTPHGGFIIHGRSDAVLNPGGVRIGTAEIYRQVERLEEVRESIVIGQQWDDDVRVVLFVVLQDGVTLDDTLRQSIRSLIRENTTPRHVPAKILAVADIPRTLSGKIVELAVRNVVHGEPVKNTDALANPEALDLYRDLPELAT